MNISVLNLSIPLLILTLFSAPYSFAEETTGNGSLTFYYDLNEGECTMAVADKAQLAIFEDDKPTPGQPCKANGIRQIQFNNVRSAVSVWLGSHKKFWIPPHPELPDLPVGEGELIGCPSQGETPNNFLFEFRTVKLVTTHERITLDHLTDDQVGKPILPGILLKSRTVRDVDDINRELSCIRINLD
jgi:hypothetical protein